MCECRLARWPDGDELPPGRARCASCRVALLGDCPRSRTSRDSPGERRLGLARRRALALSAGVIALGAAALGVAGSWGRLEGAKAASRPALVLTLGPASSASRDGDEPPAAVALATLPLDAPGAQPKVVLQGFAYLGRPAVSQDGTRALFAGRRVSGDPLEVWEAPLDGSGERRIVKGGECLEPSYLPDGRIVYGRTLQLGIVQARAVHAGSPVAGGSPPVVSLHTCLSDGANEHRITFGQACDQSPVTLPDGRVAFRRTLNARGAPGRLFALNPDGTGLQLYCDPGAGASIEAGPWVAGDRVLFVEALGGVRRLAWVSWRAPMAGVEVLESGPPEMEALATEALDPGHVRRVDSGLSSLSSLCPLPGGGILASMPAASKGWTLRRLCGDGPPGGEVVPGTFIASLVGADPGAGSLQAVDVALAAPSVRPLGVTSVVDEQKSTGTLLCLDVYASRVPAVVRAKRGTYHTVRVMAVEEDRPGGEGAAHGEAAGREPAERGANVGEAIAGEAIVAEAPILSDGSFALEVPADRPLRLRLLGPGGLEAEDPGPFWVRPNENRGCVGCHEDPESSPENRVPLALERGATPAETTRGPSPSQAPPAGRSPVAAAGSPGGS